MVKSSMRVSGFGFKRLWEMRCITSCRNAIVSMLSVGRLLMASRWVEAIHKVLRKAWRLRMSAGTQLNPIAFVPKTLLPGSC